MGAKGRAAMIGVWVITTDAGYNSRPSSCALAPAVNDPTTTVQLINQIDAPIRAACRRAGNPVRRNPLPIATPPDRGSVRWTAMRIMASSEHDHAGLPS